MKYFLIFIASLVLAHTIYIPNDFDVKFTKDFKIKKYDSLRDVNFSNAFVVVKSDYVPFIFKNDFKVIA